jgi:hypothetical protein
MVRALVVAVAAAAGVTLGGCTTVVVLGAYDIATDARALPVQQTDGAIAKTIRSELMETGLRPFLAVDVFCHQGLVVLTGVTAPGSDAGTAPGSSAASSSTSTCARPTWISRSSTDTSSSPASCATRSSWTRSSATPGP